MPFALPAPHFTAPRAATHSVECRLGRAAALFNRCDHHHVRRPPGRGHCAPVCSSTATFGEGSGTVQTSGAPSRSSSSPEASPAGKGSDLSDIKAFLEVELPRIFRTGGIARERYAESFSFEDPVTKYTTPGAHATNARLLATLFDIKFTLFNLLEDGPSQLTARWSMEMKSKLLLWRPTLTFTGKSFFVVDTYGGKLLSQTDVWDAVGNNTFPSVEGIGHIIRQATSLQLTPNLETPSYTVLRKARDYEIRQYEPFLVAETSMPTNVGPAGGDGFNDLAGYIFGGNNRRVSMEMTTPVITTAGQAASSVKPAMQFPMEARYGLDAAGLPAPENSGVTRKREEGGIVAATSFSGLPLDFQVMAAERRLRGALLVDGLQPADTYKLARYNDPFTPPPLRRNEVLIALEDFDAAA